MANGLNELMKLTGLSEDDILVQTASEYERGYRFVETKRQEFESDLKLYNNQKKNKDKIGDTTLFNVHSALMARAYVDNPQVKFMSEKMGKDDVLMNLNATYREDFDCDDYEQDKYNTLWNVFFYGVGIDALKGWDGLKKKNVFESVDPRNWIPDPDGDYYKGEYSYSGFEKRVTKSELESMGIWSEDLSPLTNNNYRGAGRNHSDDQIRARLNTSDSTYNQFNEIYQIYYHFSTFNGRKALVITGNNQTLLLKVKVLKAVKKYEKKDPAKIPFPFSFTNWKPRTGNPFGDRVADFTRDVQKAKALIANLRLDKSKAELYPSYIYNSRLIKNRADLDFGFNKFIAANPLEGESLNNAVIPMQKDFRADNSYIIDQSLDSQVQKSTSIGSVVQGSTPSRREAATTNDLIQDNTDINLGLTEKIISWGLKQKLELWYRGYIENFLKGDDKTVMLDTGMGLFPTTLTKDDFIGEDSVKIVIKTNTEVEKEFSKQRAAYAQAIPLLQTIQRPLASQNFTYRDYLEMLGMSKEKIDVQIPKTPQEVIAQQNVEILKEGEFVEVKADYDVLTHLLVLKTAPTGLNTELYRQGLIQMYIQQGGDEGNLGGLTEVSESVQNNVTAQAGAALNNEGQQILQ